LYLVVLGTFAIFVMLFLPKGVWGEIAWRWDIRLFPTQRVLSRTSCGSDLAK
jgi:branched-chain amino acid transport system permease protein